MEYQSFGRYQKPKGCNMKQVLKLTLVLVFSVWFLYQIKQTETKNYGGQTKVVAGCDAAKLLGRKGMSTRLDERSLPESRKVDSVGDAKSEVSLKETGKDEDNRIKEKGIEMQKNVSAANAGVIMEEIDEVQSYHDENGENAGVIMEEIDEVQSYHDENGVPPDSNEETEVKEEGNEMHKNVVASAANAAVTMEELDEVLSFHDENGVPPESNEENISTFSKVNWLKKINVYEVTNGEDNDVEMNLEGSTNATQDSKEINTGTKK